MTKCKVGFCAIYGPRILVIIRERGFVWCLTYVYYVLTVYSKSFFIHPFIDSFICNYNNAQFKCRYKCRTRHVYVTCLIGSVRVMSCRVNICIISCNWTLWALCVDLNTKIILAFVVRHKTAFLLVWVLALTMALVLICDNMTAMLHDFAKGLPKKYISAWSLH